VGLGGKDGWRGDGGKRRRSGRDDELTMMKAAVKSKVRSMTKTAKIMTRSMLNE
jgi:hypothetical protein